MSDERLMTLPELASYLHLAEKTVLKLAVSKQLPGLQLEGQWRFQRDSIEEWVVAQTQDRELDFSDVPDGMYVPIGDLLPGNAVIEDLQGTNPISAIEEMAARAWSNGWLNDKPWFVGAVVEREALASTAMEGGVAFLHTRTRDHSKIARPFVMFARSYDGIDFGAPDGEKTYLFFLLGLKYDRLHLPILGRLARALRNPSTIAKLRSIPSPSKLRALLIQEDAGALANNAGFAVEYKKSKPQLDRQMRLRKIMAISASKEKEAQKAKKAAKKAPKKTTKKATTKTPTKKVAAAKKTTKKPAAKKATSKKTTTKAAPKKKAPAKKAATKKVTAKKAAPKAAKKTTSKKATTKKTTAKKTTTKTAAKKTTTKTAAKKTTTKKKK